jgi:hypothetical protein
MEVRNNKTPVPTAKKPGFVPPLTSEEVYQPWIMEVKTLSQELM